MVCWRRKNMLEHFNILLFISNFFLVVSIPKKKTFRDHAFVFRFLRVVECYVLFWITLAQSRKCKSNLYGSLKTLIPMESKFPKIANYNYNSSPKIKYNLYFES